jgi:hypothetical protein
MQYEPNMFYLNIMRELLYNIHLQLGHFNIYTQETFIDH